MGVHIRGTDFHERNKNHPIAVCFEQYIEKIREIYEKGIYTKIFLATDESRVIEKMSEVFGEASVCCYKGTLRSSDGLPVHKSRNNRQYHRFLLGCEVLRDAYTLAKCSGFIAGKSQVSLAVRILKRSWNQEWSDLQILDNGIYK